MTKIQELEQAMLQLKKEDTKENFSRLMELAEQCEFRVPAVLPPDTDPRLVKQILDSNGREMALPDGVAPRPAILQNKKGENFLPIFTSDEQIHKGKSKAPVILGLPFRTCMDVVTSQEIICGFVINPFDHGITINLNKKEEAKQQQKEVKMTEPQLHAMLRQQLEASILPTALFEQKDELLQEIKEREGEALLEFYTEIYPEQVSCPYTADAFEVMTLNIREDLSIFRIAMPTDKLVPGTCPMVLVAWNPETETLRYFGIVKGNDGEKAHIMEAFEDGTKKDLGEAPSEGSELQFIIDMNEK